MGINHGQTRLIHSWCRGSKSSQEKGARLARLTLHLGAQLLGMFRIGLGRTLEHTCHAQTKANFTRKQGNKISNERNWEMEKIDVKLEGAN